MKRFLTVLVSALFLPMAAMAFTTIISDTTVTTADLTGLDGSTVTLPHEPGAYVAYCSSKVNIPNGVEAFEVFVSFENNYKSASDGVPVNHNFAAIIETQDDAGKWYPIHGMIDAFQGSQLRTKAGGRNHVLSYGPNVTTADTPIDVTAGGEVISRDHRKQGRMPDDFRVCVILDENRAAGDPGQFASIDLSISYDM